MTGQEYDVSAVLTFPGYCVIERKLGPVRVVNPKVLPQVLTGRGKEMLGSGAIDLVHRQLEGKCRNVEDLKCHRSTIFNYATNTSHRKSGVIWRRYWSR